MTINLHHTPLENLKHYTKKQDFLKVNTVNSIMTIKLLTINNFITIFQIWIQARNKVSYITREIKIIIVESTEIQKKVIFHCIFSKLNASFAFLVQRIPCFLESFQCLLFQFMGIFNKRGAVLRQYLHKVKVNCSNS